MKIAIIGPRNKLPKPCAIEIIAQEIVKERKIVTLAATGGMNGFPTEVGRKIKALLSPERYFLVAYTPCKSQEWRTYQDKGWIPQESTFDGIYRPSENSTPDIKLRALERIPRIIEGSGRVLAYLNGPGNTHMEVMSALSLEIPTFCLVDNADEERKWKEIYEAISRNNGLLRVHSNPHELMYHFVGEL